MTDEPACASPTNRRKPIAVATSSDLRGMRSRVPRRRSGFDQEATSSAKASTPAAPKKGKTPKDAPKAAPAIVKKDKPACTRALSPHPRRRRRGSRAFRLRRSSERWRCPTTRAWSIRSSRASRARSAAERTRARQRAPGILDRIAVRDPAASPDVLAIAGWISPFGSNRSGWLNLANDRARDQHDTATQSFALRRMTAAHLSSRMASTGRLRRASRSRFALREGSGGASPPRFGSAWARQQRAQPRGARRSRAAVGRSRRQDGPSPSRPRSRKTSGFDPKMQIAALERLAAIRFPEVRGTGLPRPTDRSTGPRSRRRRRRRSPKRRAPTR